MSAVDPSSDPIAPGEQARVEWLGAPALRMLRRALIAWALLGPVLYLLAGITGKGWPSLAATTARVADLAGPGLLFLLGPVLVLPLLMGLLRQPWQAGLDRGVLMGAVALLGLAGVWLGIGVAAALRLDDPWESLPFVRPPYLDGFVAGHPQYRVTTLTGVRDVYLRAPGGLFFHADGNRLAPAEVRLQACESPPSPADLGGLVPFPGARCSARLSICPVTVQDIGAGSTPRGVQATARPGDCEVTYQFALDPAISADDLKRHFMSWAEARGAQAQASGQGFITFQAQAPSRHWDVSAYRERGLPTRIYIAAGGATPIKRQTAADDETEGEVEVGASGPARTQPAIRPEQALVPGKSNP